MNLMKLSIAIKFYYLVIFSLPFLAVSPLIMFYGVPTGVIFGMLVLATLLAYGWEKGIKRLFVTVGQTPLMKLLLVFLLVNLISVVKAGLESGLDTENYLEFAYLAFSIVVFWLTASLVQNEITFTGVFRAYFLAAFISVIWSLYITLGFMAGIDTGQPLTWTVPRLFGTSAEPQVYGNYLLSVIPPLTVFLLVSLPVAKRLAMVIGFILLVLAMVMTFAAGPWVGLVGSWFILIIGYKYFKATGIKAFFGSLSVVAIIVVLIHTYLFPGYGEGFKSIAVKFGFQPEKVEQLVQLPAGKKAPAALQAKETYHLSLRSVSERQAFRQAAWNMFRTHPVFGVGTGNYGYLYNTYRPPGAEAFPFVAKAHNQYLEVLAETGMVGFAVLVLIIIRVPVMAWQAFRANRAVFWRAAVLGVFAGLAGIAVQGYSFGIFVHIYTWVLLGLLAGAYRRTMPARNYM